MFGFILIVFKLLRNVPLITVKTNLEISTIEITIHKCVYIKQTNVASYLLSTCITYTHTIRQQYTDSNDLDSYGISIDKAETLSGSMTI